MANPYDTQTVDTTLEEKRGVIADFVNNARLSRMKDASQNADNALPAPFLGQWQIPQESTYSAPFNWYQRYYYNYFDEALIDSYDNALAMRNDAFIHELLRHRQLPVVAMEHKIECEDENDPDQILIQRKLTKILKAVPYLQQLKLQLLEAIFYGKSGVQLFWNKKRVAGGIYNTVTNHSPVQGDKIAYRYGKGTPGILIYSGDLSFVNNEADQKYIEAIDKGRVFWLEDDYYRDCFIFHEFERTDTDYLYESNKALAVHGLGLRDRLYWAWNMRAELIGWMFDALQRVGANGMLYAFFQAGNPQAMEETMNALRSLVKENIAAFPLNAGETVDKIQKIDVAAVGHEILFNLIEHFEGIMRRAVLGQNLSSQSESTGLGSGVAYLQAGQFESIKIYDSSCLNETLEQQLMNKIIKLNKWPYKGRMVNGEDLPFSYTLKAQWNELEIENDRGDKEGFTAPKSKKSSVSVPRTVNASVKKEEPETFEEDSSFVEMFQRDPNNPGILVSLSIPDEIARTIIVEDGEPKEDLHITICYLGKLSDVGAQVADTASKIVKLLANNSRPLYGHIGGLGRFSATEYSDNKDVLYCGVNLPGLTDFRNELLHVFNLAGIPYKNNHGYTPHITLKYMDENEEAPIYRIPNISSTFNYVRFSVGDVVLDYPLSY